MSKTMTVTRTVKRKPAPVSAVKKPPASKGKKVKKEKVQQQQQPEEEEKKTERKRVVLRYNDGVPILQCGFCRFGFDIGLMGWFTCKSCGYDICRGCAPKGWLALRDTCGGCIEVAALEKEEKKKAAAGAGAGAGAGAAAVKQPEKKPKSHPLHTNRHTSVCASCKSDFDIGLLGWISCDKCEKDFCRECSKEGERWEPWNICTDCAPRKKEEKKGAGAGAAAAVAAPAPAPAKPSQNQTKTTTPVYVVQRNDLVYRPGSSTEGISPTYVYRPSVVSVAETRAAAKEACKKDSKTHEPLFKSNPAQYLITKKALGAGASEEAPRLEPEGKSVDFCSMCWVASTSLVWGKHDEAYFCDDCGGGHLDGDEVEEEKGED